MRLFRLVPTKKLNYECKVTLERYSKYHLQTLAYVSFFMIKTFWGKTKQKPPCMCSKLFILIIFVLIGIYTSEMLRIFCTCWNAAKVHVHAPLFPARCCFSTRPLWLSQSETRPRKLLTSFFIQLVAEVR